MSLSYINSIISFLLSINLCPFYFVIYFPIYTLLYYCIISVISLRKHHLIHITAFAISHFQAYYSLVLFVELYPISNKISIWQFSDISQFLKVSHYLISNRWPRKFIQFLTTNLLMIQLREVHHNEWQTDFHHFARTTKQNSKEY